MARYARSAAHQTLETPPFFCLPLITPRSRPRVPQGYLDQGEIRLAIKNVAPQITEMEITLMLATADNDKDAKITFNEWKDLMLHGARPRMAWLVLTLRLRLHRRLSYSSHASAMAVRLLTGFVRVSPRCRLGGGHAVLGAVWRARHACLAQGPEEREHRHQKVRRIYMEMERERERDRDERERRGGSGARWRIDRMAARRHKTRPAGIHRAPAIQVHGLSRWVLWAAPRCV